MGPVGGGVSQGGIGGLGVVPRSDLEPSADRLERLRLAFVEYDQVSVIWGALDQLLASGNKGRAIGVPANCLMLSGESGSGKSRTVREWMKKYPGSVSHDGDEQPVVYVEVEASCTTKSLGEAILAKLNVPGRIASRATESAIRQCVTHQLREQKVQVLILDEIQGIIEQKSKRVIYRVADMVKDLLNAAVCPIVLCGMPESLAIYTENRQLRRRSAGTYSLNKFDWNNKDDAERFRLVLLLYEKAHSPFPEITGIHRPSIAHRIWQVTDGLAGCAFDFLYQAAARGLAEGRQSLSIDVMRRTAEILHAGNDPGWMNPFSVPDAEVFATPPRSASRRAAPTSGGF